MRANVEVCSLPAHVRSVSRGKQQERQRSCTLVRHSLRWRSSESDRFASVCRADEEAKKKLDKVAEIKRLHGQINALKSELVRREDELKELKEYKHFLDQITPSVRLACLQQITIESHGSSRPGMERGAPSEAAARTRGHTESGNTLDGVRRSEQQGRQSAAQSRD